MLQHLDDFLVLELVVADIHQELPVLGALQDHSPALRYLRSHVHQPEAVHHVLRVVVLVEVRLVAFRVAVAHPLLVFRILTAMGRITTLIVGDEAHRTGVLVVDGGEPYLIGLGIFLDDTTIAYGNHLRQPFDDSDLFYFSEILLAERQEPPIFSPVRISGGVRSKVIIHAIDVVHVGHVDKTAELLMQAAVAEPVAELRAALSFESIDKIVWGQAFGHGVDNLFVQSTRLLYLRLGIAEERIEALLADELVALVDDHLHDGMDVTDYLVLRHKEAFQHRGVRFQEQTDQFSYLIPCVVVAAVSHLGLVADATEEFITSADIDTTCVDVAVLIVEAVEVTTPDVFIEQSSVLTDNIKIVHLNYLCIQCKSKDRQFLRILFA